MKRLFKKWRTLFNIPCEYKTIVTESVSPPINDGLRRKHCPCGGIIISSGQGVIRELCSHCGKPYHEFIRRR